MVQAQIGHKLIQIVGAKVLGRGLCKIKRYTHIASSAKYMKKPAHHQIKFIAITSSFINHVKWGINILPAIGITIRPTGGINHQGLI